MAKDRAKTRFNKKLSCGLPMYDGIVGSDGRALPNPTAYLAFRKHRRRRYLCKKQRMTE